MTEDWRIDAPASLSTSFDYLGQNLRTFMIAGEPWFVAVDACKCLGLVIRPGGMNASHHCTALAAGDKRSFKAGDAGWGEIAPILAKGVTRALIISESGLYTLIMRANPSRPEVFNFQQWVTKDVLPSIRKTGGYLLNESKRATAHADTKDAMPLPADLSTQSVEVHRQAGQAALLLRKFGKSSPAGTRRKPPMLIRPHSRG